MLAIVALTVAVVALVLAIVDMVLLAVLLVRMPDPETLARYLRPGWPPVRDE